MPGVQLPGQSQLRAWSTPQGSQIYDRSASIRTMLIVCLHLVKNAIVVHADCLPRVMGLRLIPLLHTPLVCTEARPG